jgi:mannose-6-phosphate isomerase-like protein (cupin superfamily)
MAMAVTGQILDEGAEQIEFLATAADTDGMLVECRIQVAPGRPAPPEHSHPKLEERFSVEHGRMGYVLGDQRLEVGSGGTVIVPPGTNHTFWNAGDDELVVVSGVRPAMRFEDFVETVHVLIRDGRLAPGGRRANPLLMAVVAREYRDEWRLTRLSPVARALLPLLAFAGRRLGYRAHYSINADHLPAHRPPTV